MSKPRPNKLPREQEVAIEEAPQAGLSSPPTRSLLVPDDSLSGMLVERRQFDCQRLFWCEEKWILEHHGAQAKCPEGCAGFVQRIEDKIE